MKRFLLLLFFFLIQASFLISQTGKITGRITDAKTNEPLIGANVVVLSTTLGAATDVNGNYDVINIPPGKYSIKISSIGYSAKIVTDIVVNIDQTTIINAQLEEKTIQTEEVVVVAQTPVVQHDVSASRVNLDITAVEKLPVVSVENAVALQAGIQVNSSGQLNVRGGYQDNADQTSFILNGMNLRDERDNTPYTGISLTSVQEIQVQTGGFNAEYGNIRSGLVNVVTKEGQKNKYSFSFLSRYSPPAQKHFGESANSPNSYWIRPYIDPAVAFEGTKNGSWDDYIQRQYQEFRGWNKVAEELASDSDPTNDLTPEAAQKLFLWQHRRALDITKPDYDVDMSFNGPVPVISHQLGDLRFAFSYRRSQSMYLIPLSDDAYRDYNYQMKLTSDISDRMKITADGLIARQTGTNSTRNGTNGIFTSPASIARNFDLRSGASYLDARVFADQYWDPTQIDRTSFGIKLTTVLSANTFYEVYLNRVSSKYSTNPTDPRNTAKLYEFGGIYFDESPIGYISGLSNGIGSSMNMGLGYSNSIDSSKLATYTAKFDIASQVDKYNYIKAGVELNYTDNNINYALIEPSLPSNNAFSKWHTFPKRGAIYAQDKLEFEGMVANLGLRLDYSDPGGEWYDLSPYDPALSGSLSLGIDTLVAQSPVKKQLTLSPRLGIAFPISINSKLYFNYGHFRQLPIPEDLFLLRRSTVNNQVTRLADPNNPLPLTVAYELGYEQSAFDQLLIRVAGYYKDVKDQPRLVTFTSRDNSVRYDIPQPNNYEDIRGFEITLQKNRGDWIRGFVNYTYSVGTRGFFGLRYYYQNPADQRDVERTTSAFEQTKPVPQPYVKANFDLFTPLGFGPEFGGIKLLEDIRANFLVSWSSGTYFSWTGPGGVSGQYPNNIQWKDYFNVNMRLSKAFSVGPTRIELFVDINNLLDTKHMSYRAGFADQNDYDDYMKSLHLPEEYRKFGTGYDFVAGDDKPGDYRTGEYHAWDPNASQAQKDEWTKNKSYIDMPNLSYLTFLNPRDVFWGLRFSFEFK